MADRSLIVRFIGEDSSLSRTSKNLQTAFSDLRKKVATTDGAFAKAKVGVKGLGDMFKTVAKNPAALAGGVAAVGTAAARAVEQFSDLGVEVGKFADATGTTTTAASRLMEVTGDLGISTDSVEKSLSFMNKALGNSPDLFKQLGVQIAYAKDGSVDVAGTFLNVVDVLNNSKDPMAKAATATKLLGRGWADSAELIAKGSKEIKKSMDAVSDAKTFDDDKVAKARAFRDTMDDLRDKFEDIAITVGEEALPAVESLATAFTGLAKAAALVKKLDPFSALSGGKISLFQGAVGLFAQAWDRLTNLPSSADDNPVAVLAESFDTASKSAIEANPNLELVAENIENITKAIESGAEPATADLNAVTKTLNVTVDEAIEYARRFADAEKIAAAATKKHDDAVKVSLGNLKRFTEALGKAHQASYDVLDTQISLTDAQRRANQTQRYFNSALADYNTTAADAEASTDAVAQSYDDAMAAAETAAQAAVDLAEIQNGPRTLTAAEKQHIYAESLNETASKVEPGSKLREGLDNLIYQVGALDTTVRTGFEVDTTSAMQKVGAYINLLNQANLIAAAAFGFRNTSSGPKGGGGNNNATPGPTTTTAGPGAGAGGSTIININGREIVRAVNDSQKGAR